MATKADREAEIAKAIASAVQDEALADALGTLAELRKLGVLHRPTYRLSSPYGSGMSHFAARDALTT